MKKILVILLVTMMLFTMTACGGKSSTEANGNGGTAVSADASSAGNSGAEGGESSGTVEEAAADENTSSDGGSPAAGNTSGDIYKTPGMELTDFGSSFTDMEEPYSDSISSMDSADMEALNASMAVALPNVELALFAGYDILSVDDLPKEEGKLFMSGYDAVREKSGSKINFSASYTFPEDRSGTGYLKGDKATEKGVLDTSTNELTYESVMERDGKLISRAVMEAVILKDGTHLMQYFKVSQSYREGDPPAASAVFKRFNKDDFKGISAKLDPNYEFKYDSILGKGDIQPDAMAKNYTIDGTFTVTGGKAEYKK